jgi:hypothetical protein
MNLDKKVTQNVMDMYPDLRNYVEKDGCEEQVTASSVWLCAGKYVVVFIDREYARGDELSG